MKRFIPTILLVVICIGGFWYASSKDFFQEKKDEPKSLITLKQEDVQSISRENRGAADRSSPDDSGWEMKSQRQRRSIRIKWVRGWMPLVW